MALTNPLQFIQQVRAEVSKVVWPSRREVMLTSAMVFMLAIVTAAFFFLVDLETNYIKSFIVYLEMTNLKGTG